MSSGISRMRCDYQNTGRFIISAVIHPMYSPTGNVTYIEDMAGRPKGARYLDVRVKTKSSGIGQHCVSTLVKEGRATSPAIHLVCP
jgi:hypothetical protein